MAIGKIVSPEDLQDIGFYLQGLLSVMAADNHLHEKQKREIRKFAGEMGFEKNYIENAIHSVLENKHISRKPSRFHSKSTATSFLIEAAHIAVCDGLLHPGEKEWLLEAAALNDIDGSLVTDILSSVPLSTDVPGH